MTINTLADLIALVESNGNPHAMRYEPKYNFNLKAADDLRSILKCSVSTATTICKTSWGKFQIMGDHLAKWGYLGGYAKMWPGAFTSHDDAQNRAFQEYCIKSRCNYTLEEVISSREKRADFAKKYNGPGNVVAYSARLIEVYNDRF
jgi:L-lactate utilization protein LutB